jgi:hypothetical protein
MTAPVNADHRDTLERIFGHPRAATSNGGKCSPCSRLWAP